MFRKIFNQFTSSETSIHRRPISRLISEGNILIELDKNLAPVTISEPFLIVGNVEVIPIEQAGDDAQERSPAAIK